MAPGAQNIPNYEIIRLRGTDRHNGVYHVAGIDTGFIGKLDDGRRKVKWTGKKQKSTQRGSKTALVGTMRH